MPRRTLAASYTVPELADLAGMSRQAMGRLLDKLDVKMIPGRPRRVLLSEIRRGAPDLWDSILEVRSQSGR